jgi:hypothetical protein
VRAGETQALTPPLIKAKNSTHLSNTKRVEIEPVDVLRFQNIKYVAKRFFRFVNFVIGTLQPCKANPCLGPITFPISALVHFANRKGSLTSDRKASGQAYRMLTRRAGIFPALATVMPTPQTIGGDAPDFVEVGEAGIAVDDAMRHQNCLQLVG